MTTQLKPPTGASGGDFEQHVAGSYMAVCADVYVKEEDNYFYGKVKDPKKDPNKLDDRKTVTKAYLVFLTEHPSADGKPSYVHAKESYSWGTADFPSNLFKLVQGWYPTATPEQIRDMDLLKLKGQSAYITVTHNNKGYASVASASKAPAGLPKVLIPADYKTWEERQAAKAAAPDKNPNPVQPRADAPPIAGYPAGPAFKDVPGGPGIGDDITEQSPF
jgi:hypothetical protein